MRKLIFNRYWICDRSGSGRGKWLYFIGDFGDDKGYAREWVIERYETWAHHAESYIIDIELDVKPPKEFLEKKLKEHEDSLSYYNEATRSLKNLIEGYK